MPEPLTVIAERAREAISLPAEVPALEFKSSCDFETLKYSIAKTAMAMANLRDGGLIIIGVAQREDRNFVPTGIEESHGQTYVQEMVYEFVNSYASPPIELRVMMLDHEDKRFVIIAVPPFERTPVVCRKNTPDGTKKGDQMREGDFFVRTGDRVATERVKSAGMMSELLEMAVIRRTAEQNRLRRGAAAESITTQNRLDEEVKDVADLF